MSPAQPFLKVVGPRPGELFADPAVSAVWAALLTLDVSLQHEFLARLRERLAVPEASGGSHVVRVARLVSAVREAHGLLLAQASADPGFDPTNPPALTEDAYNALRAGRRADGWPAASNLRRWVQGGWNDVLRRAMLSTVPDGDATLTVTLGDFTWPEVSGALLAFRDGRAGSGHPYPDDFSLSDMLAWARLPGVVALPGRRPRSVSPFDKFGGFLAVKEAALAGKDAPGGNKPRRAARAGRLRPASGYGYCDDELRAAMAEVVAFLGGRVPTAGAFTQARKAILEAEAERGLPARAFPSYNKLIGRWRPWDAALVACGLAPYRDITVDALTGRSDRPNPPSNEIPDADLLAGLLEAFEDRGKPFSQGVYVQYVKERGRVAKSGRRLATYSCIYHRYRGVRGGPWRHACDLALPEGWHARD